MLVRRDLIAVPQVKAVKAFGYAEVPADYDAGDAHFELADVPADHAAAVLVAGVGAGSPAAAGGRGRSGAWQGSHAGSSA